MEKGRKQSWFWTCCQYTAFLNLPVNWLRASVKRRLAPQTPTTSSMTESATICCFLWEDMGFSISHTRFRWYYYMPQQHNGRVNLIIYLTKSVCIQSLFISQSRLCFVDLSPSTVCSGQTRPKAKVMERQEVSLFQTIQLFKKQLKRSCHGLGMFGCFGGTTVNFYTHVLSGCITKNLAVPMVGTLPYNNKTFRANSLNQSFHQWQKLEGFHHWEGLLTRYPL